MTEEKKDLRLQGWLPYIFLALVAIGGIRGIIGRMHYAESAKDTLKWNQLAQVSTEGQKVVYSKTLLALDGKEICISGYIFPLQGQESQSHFLLSAYQPTCPYCMPGGPKELIEIKGGEKIDYGWGRTTLRGRLHLLKTPEELGNGMFYEMSDVAAVQE